MGAVARRHALAVVPDMHGEAGVVACQPDFDLRAGEADGIVHEVGDDVLNCGAVGVHDAEFRRVCPPCNGLVGFSRDGVVAVYDAAHDFGYFDWLRLKRSVGGFELNEDADVGHHQAEVGRLHFDFVEEFGNFMTVGMAVGMAVGAVLGGAEVCAKLALFAQDAPERPAEVVVEQLEILLRNAAPVPHIALRCAVAQTE